MIIVSGGAGFIGYHLCKKLVSLGHKVAIYDNLTNFANLDKHEFYLEKRMEFLRDNCKFIEWFEEADIFIHLAAIPLATYCNQEREEGIENNLFLTTDILEQVRDMKLGRFVYASSSFVYGNFVNIPTKETDPTNPIDLYGGAKLASETMVKVYSKRFHFPYTIIRPSAVYGPTDCNNRVSQIFVEKFLKGETLTLENDNPVDFTYVEDLVDGIILAMTHPLAEDETFNMTYGEGRTPKEFAEILGAKYEYKESDIIRPKRGALDITKAKKLGYYPKFPLEKGLPLYVDYVKGVLDEV